MGQTDLQVPWAAQYNGLAIELLQTSNSIMVSCSSLNYLLRTAAHFGNHSSDCDLNLYIIYTNISYYIIIIFDTHEGNNIK